MLGCALPARPGTAPPSRWLAAWLTIPASDASYRPTVTCWPSPVTARAASAARIPLLAYSPVTTSRTATPALTGVSSPVTDISPEAACMSRS